jgi:uncharacterized protein
MLTMATMDTQQLIEICRQNDVVMVGVFGSVARNQANEQSDLDLLVSFIGRKTILGMVKLERELSAALGVKVDLVTENSISPYLRERILHELQVIYDAR